MVSGVDRTLVLIGEKHPRQMSSQLFVSNKAKSLTFDT